MTEKIFCLFFREYHDGANEKLFWEKIVLTLHSSSGGEVQKIFWPKNFCLFFREYHEYANEKFSIKNSRFRNLGLGSGTGAGTETGT